MRISEFAAATGVAPRLLRYYEQQGLLTPARDSRGWRVYEDADLERVRAVRALLDVGIPTALTLRVLDSGPDPELLHEVAAFHDRIDSRVRCLARNRDALAAWLAQDRPA